MTAAALGVSLMTLNVVGLHVDYRTPAFAHHTRAHERAGPARSESLVRRGGEADRAYFARLARGIRLRMASGWDHSSSRVSVADNWLLHGAGRIAGTYRSYEFVDPDRALRRGYGYCSQDANIAFGKLRDSGFRPRNVLLPRHTLVAVEDRSGREVIVDPSHGVVVPHSLAAIQRRPELVKAIYAGLRRDELAPDRIAGPGLGRLMARVYAAAPVAINAGRATPHTAVIEPWAYRLKWAIPVLLLVAAGLTLTSGSDSRARRFRLGRRH